MLFLQIKLNQIRKIEKRINKTNKLMNDIILTEDCFITVNKVWSPTWGKKKCNANIVVIS